MKGIVIDIDTLHLFREVKAGIYDIQSLADIDPEEEKYIRTPPQNHTGFIRSRHNRN